MRIIRFIENNKDDGQPDSQSPQQAASQTPSSEAPPTEIAPGPKKFNLWSAKNNIIERAPRYMIILEAELKVKKLFSTKLLGRAETVDISITGAKIMFPQAIGFGTKLLVRLSDFSSKEYLVLVGNVVRCRRNYVGGTRYPVFEIGLSFKNMNRRKAEILMNWVKTSDRFGSQSFVK